MSALFRASIYNSASSNSREPIIGLKIEYSEFIEKYDSSVNPSHYAKRSKIWYGYNTIGELVWQGIIQLDLVDRVMLGIQVMEVWNKWEHIIKECREKENAPDIWNGFEYLYNEIKNLRAKKGYPEFTYPTKATELVN